MNTNSNVYTVIYTTIVCVVVAAILAFVSQSLKDRQEANEKAENISQILTAAQFGEKSSWTEQPLIVVKDAASPTRPPNEPLNASPLT